MIAPQCFTIGWIGRVKDQLPHAADATIEKCIRALALLERLAQSGLRFTFKGGTCMMLQIPVVRRLSVDIDIVCTEGMARIEPILLEIASNFPFTRHNLERNPDDRPRRRHYGFHYESLDTTNREPFVRLDIVTEHAPYPRLERRLVEVPFVETENAPPVMVPTLPGLLGDKLTAFAPQTVGVRYGERTAQQIIKPMFDVGELSQVTDDLLGARDAHAALSVMENGFRGTHHSPQDALDDSIATAFRVSQLNLTREEPWDDFKRGLLLRGVDEISATLIRDEYTLDDARISASRAALVAALLRFGHTGSLARYRYDPARAGELPVALGGRFAVLNPLRETATEAFHNWHQVEILERDRL